MATKSTSRVKGTVKNSSTKTRKSSKKQLESKSRKKTTTKGRVPTETRGKSVWKGEDGWYFLNKESGENVGPYRTRDLARAAKTGGAVVAPTSNVVEVKDIGVQENPVIELLGDKVEPTYLYKVVSRLEDKFYSARVPRSSILCLEYKLGEVTRVSDEMAKAGFGICCFSSLEGARGWSGYRSTIFKVEAEVIEASKVRPSRTVLHSILPSNLDSSVNVVEVLLKASYFNDGVTPVRASWPDEMVMAKFVRLIKRVQ